MGHQAGALDMAGTWDRINVVLDFEKACQAGWADPTWDPHGWWKSKAWEAWQRVKTGEVLEHSQIIYAEPTAPSISPEGSGSR